LNKREARATEAGGVADELAATRSYVDDSARDDVAAPASRKTPAGNHSAGLDNEAGEPLRAGRADAPTGKPAGAVGATRRRATSVVKESIAPRMERVRERSVVMLEDTPDDSGLRFVAIAVFLFVVFIFLLVLNSVIK
jgi:hypothetical protein